MTGGAQDERQVLIAYRLDQADHALRQAEVLGGVEEWDGVVNRAYYAMFYAALALLLTKDLGTSKHTGVLTLVDREFVRPGLLSSGLSRMLRDAFNQRQRSDYAEMAPTTKDRALEILENARQFVAASQSAISDTTAIPDGPES